MTSVIKPAESYLVRFVVTQYDRSPWEVTAVCNTASDVENLVAACAAYNSGDECECYINGERALLELDWGLMKPKTEQASENQ